MTTAARHKKRAMAVLSDFSRSLEPDEAYKQRHQTYYIFYKGQKIAYQGQ